MSDTPVIFINKDAIQLEDLFLNEDWELSEIYKERIYSITVGKRKLNWLVKLYENKKYAKKESRNLNKLKNIKNVPSILSVGLSKTLNYVILSQAPGMDLFDYVEKHGTFSEKQIKHIAIQLFTILKNIHKKNIIHKDIKPENIVYDDKTEKITLIDFEERYTEGYCSPEQANEEKVTYKTDIWSSGVTLYFLATAEQLFQDEIEVLENPIVMKKEFSADFKDFLRCLIERDKDLRYTAKEALNHIWMSD